MHPPATNPELKHAPTQVSGISNLANGFASSCKARPSVATKGLVASASELDGPSESLFGLPNTTNNGFDVVSVRIQGEGSVVGGSITRTGTRLAIVRSTSIKRSAMELFDLPLGVGLEGKMNPGSAIGSGKVERRRTSLLEANVDVGAPA
jgi:hypothetical protein